MEQKILTPRQAQFAGDIERVKTLVGNVVTLARHGGCHPMAIMAALLDGYVALAALGGVPGVLDALRGMAAGQLDLLDMLNARQQGAPVSGDTLPKTGPCEPYTAPRTPQAASNVK